MCILHLASIILLSSSISTAFHDFQRDVTRCYYAPFHRCRNALHRVQIEDASPATFQEINLHWLVLFSRPQDGKGERPMLDRRLVCDGVLEDLFDILRKVRVYRGVAREGENMTVRVRVRVNMHDQTPDTSHSLENILKRKVCFPPSRAGGNGPSVVCNTLKGTLAPLFVRTFE